MLFALFTGQEPVVSLEPGRRLDVTSSLARATLPCVAVVLIAPIVVEEERPVSAVRWQFRVLITFDHGRAHRYWPLHRQCLRFQKCRGVRATYLCVAAH